MGRREEILDLIKKLKMVDANDLETRGISRNYLYLMHKEGTLDIMAPGLYVLPHEAWDENANLMAMAKQIPKAVISLVSALNFHQITTQIPHKLWIFLPRGAWYPAIHYPPFHLNYVSGEAFTFGVEEHLIHGVTVKIYSPAKTVADCFKFRNKIGLDISLEGLREAWKSKKASIDELVEAAKINRVLKVMQPYMEAMV
jgi:predicted transcriptional regulator of viral defense system